MVKKIFVSCSVFCFCLILFMATAFAKEINCPGGITADIPNSYQVDEEDEDSIFFVSEEDMSLLVIGFEKLEEGENLDTAKEELLKELCEEKDISIESEKTENIGGRDVYLLTGKMAIDDINMKTYFCVFQYRDKIIFSFFAGKIEDMNNEKVFRNIIQSIH